jgi:hypothetical protein
MNTTIDIKKFTSVNANRAHSSRSNRYGFVNTADIISTLNKEGWVVVGVDEQQKRGGVGKGYQRHLVTLRHKDDITKKALSVNDIVKEIRIDNSHNGLSKGKMMLGIYRCICSNQMLVSDNVLESHTIKHIGDVDAKVKAILKSMLKDAPKVLKRVGEMKKIKLTQPKTLKFAEEALQLLYPKGKWVKKNKKETVEELIKPTRQEDKEKNLWNLFNIVQEKFISGGEFMVDKKKDKKGEQKIGKKKQITRIKTNISLNMGLWDIAEKFASDN